MAPSPTPEMSPPSPSGKASPGSPEKADAPICGPPPSGTRPARARGIRFGVPPASISIGAKAASPPLDRQSPPTINAPASPRTHLVSPAPSTNTGLPPITLSSPPPSAGTSVFGFNTTPTSLASSRSSSSNLSAPPHLAGVAVDDSTPPESPPRRGPASPDTEDTPYHISEIDNATTHRAIRTIVHNEFGRIQTEAEEEPFGPGVPKMRTYFVAADLSPEGAYAIDWTIGTFLRDGDTLLVIHAVDSGEPEAGKPGTPRYGHMRSATRDSIQSSIRSGIRAQTPSGIPIGFGGAVVSDTQDAIRKLARQGSISRRRAGSLPGRARSASDSATRPPGTNGMRFARSPSVDSLRPKTWMENARLKSITDITGICTRSLAKRDVKVQIAIEVIHCKSPRHLITEAIDTLEPTLVILGSRGRSALTGVLLGSFSNYLVTKSSVPVIVARKRNPKPPQRKEPPRPHLRPVPTDRIDSPNRLVHARID